MNIRLQSNLLLATLLGTVCLTAVISFAAAEEDFYKVLGVPKDFGERQLKKVRLASVINTARESRFGLTSPVGLFVSDPAPSPGLS